MPAVPASFLDFEAPASTMAGGSDLTSKTSGASRKASSSAEQRQLTLFDLEPIENRGRNPEIRSTTSSPALGESPVVVRLPSAISKSQRASSEVLAEWDGYVEEINGDYFTARMRGLRGDGVTGKDEEAEIPVSDVDDEDRMLLAVGALFRLTITYEQPNVGAKRRYTTVQFRRLPAYTKRELEEADALAEELFNGLRLGPPEEAAGG